MLAGNDEQLVFLDHDHADLIDASTNDKLSYSKPSRRLFVASLFLPYTLDTSVNAVSKDTAFKHTRLNSVDEETNATLARSSVYGSYSSATIPVVNGRLTRQLSNTSKSNHVRFRKSSCSSVNPTEYINMDGTSVPLSSVKRSESTVLQEQCITPSYYGNVGLQNAIQATSLGAVVSKKLWVGHLGASIAQHDRLSKQLLMDELLSHYDCKVVDVADQDMEAHYHQYCKQILWKCFHYQSGDRQHIKLTSATIKEAWNSYIRVNQSFAKAIVDLYQPGDIVWVNDYHLMLLPLLLRQKIPEAVIGFFMHIPFPSSEVFRSLPVRNEILEGILGADMVAFQTYSYARHFLMTCTRLLSLETTPKGVRLDNSFVSVGIFPMGIDVQGLIQRRNRPEVFQIARTMGDKYVGRQVIIGRDKSDFVKGVREKLVGYELFLIMHPEFLGKVVLIQVALPTTEANESECAVADVVARINSRFGSIEYQPVIYLHQDISFDDYLALLTIADACLVTSLRDGMNLTSHEYIVCQAEKHSPLILSEFAGSYGSFGAALRINPYNKREVAEAIFDALTMSAEEKIQRWQELSLHVDMNSAQKFVHTFIKDLIKVHEDEFLSTHSYSLPLMQFKKLYDLYDRCEARLILLDHEGTTMPPPTKPTINVRTYENKVLHLLADLVADKRNIVYILSGRPIHELQQLVDIEGLGVCAENGAFIKYADRNDWEASPNLPLDNEWKKQVLEVLEYYTDRTPGSYIETKDTALVWHYGLADMRFASWQAAELLNHVESIVASSYPIHPFTTRKALEICPKHVHKGSAVAGIIAYHEWPPYSENRSSTRRDMILSMGDDRTDEYMFEYLEHLASAHSDGNALDVWKGDHDNSSMPDIRRSIADLQLPRFYLHSSSSVSKQGSAGLSFPHAVGSPFRKVLTCAVGKKGTKAKMYVSGYLDVGVLLEGCAKGKLRDVHPHLLVSTGRTNSSASLAHLI